jgi:hypothetical protein
MTAFVAAAAISGVVQDIARTTNQAWGAFAAARGLHYSPGVGGWMGMQANARIDGTLDGVRFAVTLYPDHRTGYFGTAVLAFPSQPLPGHLDVTRAGVLLRLAAHLSADEVSFQDPAFSESFVVKATHPATAHRLLSPGARAELVALGAVFLGYDDGSEAQHATHLLLELSGVVAREDILERSIRLATRLAAER